MAVVSQLGEDEYGPGHGPLVDAVAQAPFAALLFLPDEKLTMIWRNDAHATMTGTHGLEIVGRGMFEAFPPSEEDGGDAASQAIRDAVDGMSADHAPVEIGPYRYDLKGVDGGFAEYHWLIRMSPVIEDGAVVAVLQVAQDVTRSVLDAQLAETLKRSAAQSAALSYFSFDPATGTFKRTAAVDEMFGFAENEAGDTAAPFFDRVHPEDLPGVHAEVERVFAAPRGEVGRFDYRVPQADGRTRYLSIRAEVVTDPEDRREKLVGSFVDMTEVEENRQSLERELSLREALVGEANHRIKNSLAIALSMLRMERRALKDVEGAEADRAKTALTALEARIGAISSTHGLMQLDGAAVDVSLHALVSDLVRQMRGTADLGNTELRLTLDGEDVSLHSDAATRLGLILNEILTNALKYGLDLKGNAEVDVQVRRGAETASIIVRNRIEKENPIDAIASTKLGSMLVKQLADDQGMTVRSEAGETHYETQVHLPVEQDT